MRNFLLQSATLFGVGKISKAPGTWGTLVTVPVVFLLSYLGPLYYMGAIFFMLPFSIIAAEAYEKQSSGHDSKEIVIDEMIGFMIAMTWMPQTWQAYLAGFCLFRFLDILKPPPIRYFDRRVPGGLGVVLDDVVAGIVANIFLQLIYSQTPWLGIQNIVFS